MQRKYIQYSHWNRKVCVFVLYQTISNDMSTRLHAYPSAGGDGGGPGRRTSTRFITTTAASSIMIFRHSSRMNDPIWQKNHEKKQQTYDTWRFNHNVRPSFSPPPEEDDDGGDDDNDGDIKNRSSLIMRMMQPQDMIAVDYFLLRVEYSWQVRATCAKHKSDTNDANLPRASQTFWQVREAREIPRHANNTTYVMIAIPAQNSAVCLIMMLLLWREGAVPPPKTKRKEKKNPASHCVG